MAAPPPPPPPPPAPAQIGKPNNSKLLDSIRQGTGLKKVPEAEKNDRSVVPVAGKSGGNTKAMELPTEARGSAGAPLSLTDALKARQQMMAKGTPPSKRVVAPPPNQNVNVLTNIPKPPTQNSKPSVNSADTKPFLPPPSPIQSDSPNKSFAPPPIPPGNQDKPLVPPTPHIQSGNQFKPLPPPPPTQSGVVNKPFFPPIQSNNYEKPPPPPHIQSGALNKPFAPPPMPPGNSEKPFTPPPMQPSNQNKPPINKGNPDRPFAPHQLPMNIPPPPPPPMESKTNEVAQPTMPFSSVNRNVGYPSLNGSMKSTPPQCAPPPPPPFNPILINPPPTVPIAKPAQGLPPPGIPNVPINKPVLPIRMEMQTNIFDSRFEFPEEDSFPEPSTVLKRSKPKV